MPTQYVNTLPGQNSPLFPYLYGQLKSGYGEFAKNIGTAIEFMDWDWLGRLFGYKDAEEMARSVQDFWAPIAQETPPPAGDLWEDPSLALDPRWLLGWTARMLPFSVSSLPLGYAGGALARSLAPFAGNAGVISGRLLGILPSSFLESLEVYERAKAEGLDDPKLRTLLSTAGLAALNLLPIDALAKGKILRTAGLSSLTEWAEEPVQEAAAGGDVIEAMKRGINVIPPSFLTGGLFGAAGKLSQPAQQVPEVDPTAGLSPVPNQVARALGTVYPPAVAPSPVVGDKLGEALNLPSVVNGVVQDTIATGGATYTPGGESLAGKPGFAVGVYPNRSVILPRKPTPLDVRDFVMGNRDALMLDPEARIGAWWDAENGLGYLDLSQVMPTREEAEAVGKRLGEKAIFDLENMQEIPLEYSEEELRALDEAAKMRRKTDWVQQLKEQPFFAMKKAGPLWYSALERTVQEKLPNRGTGLSYAQALEALQKKGFFRGEEATDNGVLDWLKSKGKDKLTKDDVLKYVRENSPKLAEVFGTEDYESFDVETAIDNAVDAELENWQVEKTPDGEGYIAREVFASDEPLRDSDGNVKVFEDEIDAWDAIRYRIEEGYRQMPVDELRDMFMPYTGLNYYDPYAVEEVGAQYGDWIEPNAELGSYRELLITLKNPPRDYKAPHFTGIKNILAHVRFDDRTTRDGKKVMFIEEIQSDWHQTGRKEGYITRAEQAEADALKEQIRAIDEEFYRNQTEAHKWVYEQLVKQGLAKPDLDPTSKDRFVGSWPVDTSAQGQLYFRDKLEELRNSEEYNRIVDSDRLTRLRRDLEQQVEEIEKRPPNAPFKKAWPMLAFKRALRWAVENGYDYVAWTTGEQQAARYDLSRFIDTIYVNRHKNNEDALVLHDTNGRNILINIDRNTGEIYQAPRGFDELIGKNVKEVFGDAIGTRIMEDPAVFFEIPTNVTLGGEGMRAFYDRILPNEVKKYIKKYGGKVEQVELPFDFGEYLSVPAVKITPKMRAVLEGQPLYKVFKPLSKEERARYDQQRMRVLTNREVVWPKEKTALRLTGEITSQLDPAYDAWAQVFNVAAQDDVQLDQEHKINVRPLDFDEQRYMVEAFQKLFTYGQIPWNVMRRVEHVAGFEVQNDPDQGLEGFFTPGPNALMLNKRVIEAMVRGSDLDQRYALLTLAHELGHTAVTLARKTDNLVTHSRALQFYPAQSYASEDGTIELNDDAGYVLKEIVELYNRGLAEDAPQEMRELSEFLRYPVAQIWAGLDSIENRDELPLDAPAYAFDEGRRVLNEVWAQLWALHSVYPGAMRQYMPNAADLINRAKEAISQNDRGFVMAPELAQALDADIQPGMLRGLYNMAQAGVFGQEAPNAQNQTGPAYSALGEVPTAGRPPVSYRSVYGGEERPGAGENAAPRYRPAPRVIQDAARDRSAEETIQRARRGVQTWEATERLADLLGLDQKEVEKLLRRKYGRAFNAEQIMQAAKLVEQQMQDISTYVDDFLEKAAAGQVTEADMVEFQERQLEAVGLLSQYYGVRAEAGRALNIFRKLRSFTDKLEVLREMGKTPEMMVEIAKQFKNIEATGKSPAKYLVESAQITTFDQFLEVWVMGLLSSIPTHVVNFVSTGLVQPLTDLERIVAAGIGVVRGAKATERVTAREVLATLKGYASGIPAGLRAAQQVLKDEDATVDVFTKIDLPRKRAVPGLLGKLIRLPGRALTAEDLVWKTTAMSRELMALATRKSLADPQRRSAAWWYEHPTQDMLDEAWKQAREQTFTSPGGAIAQGLRTMRARHKWLTFVIPFINTPANIVRYALERTPLAPFFSEVRADLKGLNGPIARDMALARIIVGSGIMLWAYMLAASGRLIGGPPEDPREREIFYRLGYKPYSIWYNGQWVPFARIEPFGTLLGLAADAWRLRRYAKDVDAKKFASLVTMSLATNLTNKTYLRGLTELVNVLNEPERYGDRFVTNLASTMIPYSVGLGSVARANDPYLREARGILEGIQSRIPGLRQKLPPRVDVLGRPIKVDKDRGPLERLVSPIYRSTPERDPVLEELWRLEVYLPRSPRKFQGVELEPPEYAELLRLQNEPVYLMLQRLMASPYYQRLSDPMKRLLVEQIIGRMRPQGRLLWEMRHPDIMQEAWANRFKNMQRPGREPVM